MKAWREANADRYAEWARKYREMHADLLRMRRAAKHQATAEKAKAQMRRYYLENADRIRQYQRELVERCAPSYVAQALGLPTSEVPPDLLALKQDQLAMRRLARLLKEAAHEAQQDH